MQYEIATTREPWKKKVDGKLNKYQQLALEIRERQPEFEITVVTVMMGPSVVAWRRQSEMCWRYCQH